ncbi:MAG: amino acid racemase [Myxococcota bacterium]
MRGLRVPGVLGGMGPAATVDFMSTVLELTRADGDQDHIPMLIDHNPLVPDRQRAVHGDSGAVRLALLDMARRLERAGADFLVMPCNTAHLFIDDALEAVTLPFLSIVDVTMEALLMSRRSVGVLAADATLYSELYQTALIAAGHRVILPKEDDQQEMMRHINGTKTGSLQARQPLLEIACRVVEAGAEAIVLGSTELALIMSGETLEVPVISSTAELARATIGVATGRRPLPSA